MFDVLDFDGDNYLNRSDLRLVIKSITCNQLTDDEVNFAVDNVSIGPLCVVFVQCCIVFDRWVIFKIQKCSSLYLAPTGSTFYLSA